MIKARANYLFYISLLIGLIATGKAQANQPLSHELQVGVYAKGIYLLKLVSDKQVITKRMAIEH